MRNMRKFGRSRALIARNFAFTPFRPRRMAGPIPQQLTAPPEVAEKLGQEDIGAYGSGPYQRHGAAYPYPVPQIFQARLNLDDSLADLNAGGKVQIGGFRMNKNTAADAIKFLVETSDPSTFQMLQFALEINGLPFSQQQFFTLPFPEGPERFFREVISQANVGIVAQARAGAVLVPPLGTAEIHVFVDAYQGKFL